VRVVTRVLVLDGHTTQALACVRSLGRAGYRTIVASDRRWSLAGASRYCGPTFRLAGQSIAAFAALRAWARRQGARIVLPLTERSCLLCNAEADAWRADGITIGCGPDEMLMQAFDKARTIEHAAACGINVPPTRFPASLDECRDAAAELGFPCVIKPRFSNAWHNGEFLPDRGVAYVDSGASLAPAVIARRQGAHWPIIQRFVPGRGKGIFMLCDNGRPVTWFAHERLRDVRPSGSGSSLRRAVALDTALSEMGGRLLARLAWHGPAMLEFQDDGIRPPWLIEVNGRFWGSLQLAIDAGADLPVQWVRLLSGLPVESSAEYRPGITLRWLWGDVKRLLHIASGPPPGYPGAYPALWDGIKEVFGSQPPGTRVETWDRKDPLPAVAEWVQGVGELLERRPPANGAHSLSGANGMNGATGAKCANGA
jgi:predicted ATP-grasp superfamily ATP-dependent carboligase